MLPRNFSGVVRVYREAGLPGVARAVGKRFGYDPPSRTAIDEVAIVARALRIADAPGTMVDVGGHFGGTALPFCKAGWRVLAFEPDSLNREKLTQAIGQFKNAAIDSRALSNEEKEAVTFYRSKQSTGISGLSAFHTSHEAADTVPMTTLRRALLEHGIDKVDFLKIDTEGFDKFVLEGVPWETIQPRVIVCEFEDFKTVPLGYSFADLCEYLVDKGYRIVVSEWRPIVGYGRQHVWADFKQWPCALASTIGWGNLIAVREPALFVSVQNICDKIQAQLR